VEVRESGVLIGLITPASVNSSYVLFELGARWGAKLPLYPILAKGASAEKLPGPIAGTNALRAEREAQMHQLVKDIANELNLPPPDASVYVDQLKAVVQISARAGLFVKYDGKRIKGPSDHQFL
jgi:hypothetical protein